MADIEVKTENLSYVYSKDTPFEHTALDNANIEIEKGSFVGLIGHTGSGKSTLIQHLNGLLKPTDGRVLIDGEDIWQNPKDIRRFRFKVGLVFQYPEHQLFEETVEKDIAFGPKNMGLSEQEIKERVKEAARLTGLSEDYLEKSPFELSGGEKRRVAIAGVLAMQPEIIVLDEPTAMLDPQGRQEVVATVTRLCREKGMTVVLITHHMDECVGADRLVVMSNGSIVADGAPGEVFADVALMEREGLTVPATTRLLHELNRHGFDLALDALTVDDCADAVARAVRN